MNYQDELRAKLEAVHSVSTPEKKNTVSKESVEEKLLQELRDDFEFSQYDLDESDILRALKISEILQSYKNTFIHPQALKIFYVIARLDVIEAKKLYQFCSVELKSFKSIIYKMSQANLLFQNEDRELELTLEGKSLAQRLGIYIF